MNATIGRYQVTMDETGLVLIHPTLLKFDVTLEEAVKIAQFIDMHAYQYLPKRRDTDPQMERIRLLKPEDKP